MWSVKKGLARKEREYRATWISIRYKNVILKMQAVKLVFHEVRWCGSTGISQDQAPKKGLDFLVLKSSTIMIQLAVKGVCRRICNCIDGFLWCYMVIWSSKKVLTPLALGTWFMWSSFPAVSQKWALPFPVLGICYVLNVLVNSFENTCSTFIRITKDCLTQYCLITGRK